jgi:hypothetical protein
LPILYVTAGAAILIHRRASFPMFLAGFGVASAALLAITYATLGVPVAAKVGFCVGRSLVTPDAVAGASESGLRARGRAVVVISEDLEELFEIADRIAVMFEGRIVDQMPVAEAEVGRIGLLMAGAA